MNPSPELLTQNIEGGTSTIAVQSEKEDFSRYITSGISLTIWEDKDIFSGIIGNSPQQVSNSTNIQP